MGKKIVITQSNYIPWRGYFDLISFADEFIFFDEVQFTRRDWRNRNKLLNNNKIKWLTIPLKNKGNYLSKISQMETINNDWRINHLNIIKSYYGKTKNFDKKFQIIEKIYMGCNYSNLSEINKYFIKEICLLLDIKTKFVNIKYTAPDKKIDPTTRLLNICLEREAQIYVTGPAAKKYLNTAYFLKNNVKIKWFDYGETKPYKQVGSTEFKKNLSIIDCIMNCAFHKEKYLNNIT